MREAGGLDVCFNVCQTRRATYCMIFRLMFTSLRSPPALGAPYLINVLPPRQFEQIVTVGTFVLMVEHGLESGILYLYFRVKFLARRRLKPRVRENRFYSSSYP